MANPISSITNAITGGENEVGQSDLAQILSTIEGISTPDAAQLQLSPLAQYTNTGDLSAAQAQAAAAGPSAYGSEDLSSVPMSTMQQALSQEQEIASANGMTPQEQAQIAEAENTVNANTAGQNGAIAQQFAAEGVPQSLISAALQTQNADNAAQTANLDALQAQGQAATQGLTALSNEGALANTMYGDQTTQANTVAAAQNALNQFNAQNTQQTNLANQATQQAANTYNTTNAQTLANQNVQGEQTVQEQNQVEAPQEAASLALQKGQEEAGVGEAQANQATAAGQQAAGLVGSVLGAGATLGAGAMNAGATNNLATAISHADGGEIPPQTLPAINFKVGGPVPGQARVAGDSLQNDTVPAKLSPGEFVVPRTAMANPAVRDFLAKHVPTPRPPSDPHPSDVASVMRALSMLRAGQGA
jgi:hypothetical protein